MMNRRQFGLLSASTMLLSPSISLIKPVLAVAQEEQNNPAEAEETAFRALQEEFSSDRRIWIFAEPAGSKQRYRVVGDIVWIRASKNIPKGAELSYDYNTEGEAGMACRCRPGCGNMI